MHWQCLRDDGGATCTGHGRATLFPAPDSWASGRTPGTPDAATALWSADDASPSAKQCLNQDIRARRMCDTMGEKLSPLRIIVVFEDPKGTEHRSNRWTYIS